MRKISALFLTVLFLLIVACSGHSDNKIKTIDADTIVEGLSTPESVLYDPVADLYFISNINGSPGDKDDNGFISRIKCDGTVENIKWIDGADKDVVLNAPKGMAISGEELCVTDIDTVRIFNRKSGKLIKNISIPDAAFLNDITADSAGNLFVSDSSKKVIYKILPDKTYSVFAKKDELSGLNGLATESGLLWATAEAKIVAIDSSGKIVKQKKVPAGGLDGLVALTGGTFLVSSWDEETVYMASEGGPFKPLFKNVPSPADIGYDSRRRRVLIPLFKQNRVVIKSLQVR
jgi:hypothetical protein